MEQPTRGLLARPAAAPAALAILPLAAVLLAAAAGWLAVRRPELFEVALPSSPGELAAVALVLLLAPAAFLALLRRPALALVVLVLFVYLHLSQVLVRFHALPSLLQLLALPLLAAGLRLRGARGTAAVGTADLTVAVGAYLAVLVASIAWAAEPAAAGERVAEIVKAVAVYLLVALLAAEPRLLRRAARAAVAAGSLLAALGVWQALTGSFGSDFGGLARIKQAQIYDEVFEPRIAGPLGDPNYFAQILLILVPVALAFAWGEESWAGRSGRRRVAALAAAGLLVAGTVLTYSRGAALALVLVAGLAVLVRGVRPRQVAAGLALAVVLAALAPEGFARRLTTLQEMLPGGEEVLDPDSSFAKRRLVTAAAWRMFLDRPVLGVGAGNYGDLFPLYADRVGSDARLYEDPGERNFPHSLYLEVAAETGAVGLAALGLVILAAFASIFAARRRLRRQGDLRTAALAEGVGLALVGLLVTGLFLHGEFPRYLFLLLGLATGLALAGRGSGGGSGAQMGERVDLAPHPVETAAAGAGAAAEASTRVRRPVAVLLSRFPRVTETFILREVDELERQGQAVRLVPLIRERAAVVHREAEPWLDRVPATPWVSPEILAALGRAALSRPGALAGTTLRLAAGTLGSPSMLWRTLALLPKAALLAERLPAEGVRHLHAHFATHPTTVALAACRLAPRGAERPTFSFTVHAHDLFVDRHLLAWKLREAAFVRVISDFNRDFLARLHPWAAAKLTTVHVGVEPEAYRAAAPAADGETTDGETAEPVVLCVAALQEYKGVAVLVEACRRLRDAGVRFRCEVVGEGPLRDDLERRIEAAGLGGAVRLLGARRQDEVARRMAAARVVVQPSVVAADGQMEGIPVALMEALAAERPVAASRLSGIPELVVDGETGLLVPPGDAEALAAALARLLADDELSRRLGRAGRERVERAFRLDGTTAELLALLDRHNPPPAAGEAELTRAVVGARVVRPAAGEAEPAWAAPVGRRVGSPGGDDLEGPATGGSALGLDRVHRGADAEVAEVLVAVAPGVVASGPPADGLSGEDGHGRRPPVERLVVKRHLDRPGASRPAGDRALREAAVAARVAAWGGAPRPLGIDAERAIVIFEPCPGEPLDRRVRRLRLSRHAGGELSASMRAAGRWLAAYQSTPLADLFPSPAPAADDPTTPPPLPPASPLRARLERLRARARPDSFTPVPVHGDLWPGNLRIDGDGIARALDFEGAGLGPRYADAAWFLLHLDLYLARPGLGRRRRALADAFLAGWLGDEEAPDRAALAWFRALAAARLLERAERPRGLRQRWRRRLLVRELVAAASEGAR